MKRVVQPPKAPTPTRRARAGRGAAWPWALLSAALLSACGAPPRAPDPAAPGPAAARAETGTDADPQRLAFEQRQAERARRAEAQGQWAEAVLAWELLSLLQPDDAQVRERLAQARQRRAALVDERWAAAEAARRRGDLEPAAQRYLELLALEPTHAAAAEALRAIERERNRRSFVGKFSRLTLTRRTTGAADMQPEAGDGPRPGGTGLLEHATLLARQGDLDSAIQLLRDAGTTRTDAAHRNALADLYVAKGETLRQRQPDAARSAAEAALALDRRHPGALALLQALPPRPRPKPAAKPAAGASAPG